MLEIDKQLVNLINFGSNQFIFEQNQLNFLYSSPNTCALRIFSFFPVILFLYYTSMVGASLIVSSFLALYIFGIPSQYSTVG